MGLRDFRIVCSDADETASPGLTPPALVEALSARKAAAVQHAAAAGDLIIAADTVVALDGRVLGKPADGRTHSPCFPPSPAGATRSTPA